tara:strand:+ start:188 stop:1666 length:1479 start_codon:yes stop_codon:yes gene_type:complete
MWPAEIVGDVTAAIERLGEPAAKFFARHPGGERRAFQFFNYAGAYGFELSNTTVVTWEEGLRMRYDAHKVKKRADAVSNARAYLETGDLSSENARGVTWWSQLAPRRDEDEDEEKTTKQRAGGKAKRKRQRVSGNDGEKDASAADEIVDETGGFKFPVLARAFARGEKRVEYAPPLSVLSMGKPPPYERIRRSLFVSVPPPTKLHKSESMVCECRPPPRVDGEATTRTGCGQECLNRKLRFSCDSRTCPCGDTCSNRPLSQLQEPKTKIIRTENRGWGLFVQEPVRAGSFIVEYAGEILDEPECAARLWHDKQSGEENFYMMEISANYVIDAKFKGSIARFINSSCHPNCETQRWVDASTNETRVGIFATEDIPSGTELTYDYNFAHFGDESATSFACMCGHPKCRGTLDAAKKHVKHLHRKLRAQVPIRATKKSKKKVQKVSGTVVDYDVAKGRYKIQLDRGGDADAKDADAFVWVHLDGEKAVPHTWMKK